MVQFWLPCKALLSQFVGVLPDEKSSCKNISAERNKGEIKNSNVEAILILTEIIYNWILIQDKLNVKNNSNCV